MQQTQLNPVYLYMLF